MLVHMLNLPYLKKKLSLQFLGHAVPNIDAHREIPASLWDAEGQRKTTKTYHVTAGSKILEFDVQMSPREGSLDPAQRLGD